MTPTEAARLTLKRFVLSSCKVEKSIPFLILVIKLKLEGRIQRRFQTIKKNDQDDEKNELTLVHNMFTMK